MRFYRVCHLTATYTYVSGTFHVGPYNSLAVETSDALDRMLRQHSYDEDRHPAFVEDVWPHHYGPECQAQYGYEEDHDCTERGCADYPYDFVCGFTSLAACDEWFAGWHDALARAGYVVRVFDVPESAVRTGTFQAACLAEYVRGSAAIQAATVLALAPAD